MKRFLILMLFAGLTAGASAQQTRYVDDLYQGSTRKSKAAAKAAEEAEREAQATVLQQRTIPRTATRTPTESTGSGMPVNWTPTRGDGTTSTLGGGLENDDNELVTSYDEALQRRLEAYKSYREMDDSYWTLMESYHKMLSRKYDPELYNVITFGNEMWVEPRYISALFDGSDPAAGVQSMELIPAKAKKTESDVTIHLTLSPSWYWDDPWDYWWYNRWRYGWYGGYYGWRPYWGWSWGWYGGGWYAGWGPGWWGGWYPGWGPGWGPVYPPVWGGGYYNPRPVIWGNNRPGWGPAPGYRPGTPGGTAGRPTYTGGFRRNENGTGVAINNGGTTINRRPGAGIRPGSTGNQYNPGASTRPTISGGTTGTTTRPTVDRSYRRQTTTTPQRQTTTRTEAPRRTTTPTYSAPSSMGGGFGGGGSVGGGRGSVGGGGGGGFRR